MANSPRLAARALLVRDDRLLLVNAYPNHHLGLWCAPGGGVERGQSVPDNLIREVHEETGLAVTVGPLALINEFHDPDSGFHQVDLFFRCTLVSGELDDTWRDVAHVVSQRGWFTRDDMDAMTVKPSSLAQVAFTPADTPFYDPLEIILK
ncbi:MAG: NUDIX hydrolase [Celeribacter marinus]